VQQAPHTLANPATTPASVAIRPIYHRLRLRKQQVGLPLPHIHSFDPKSTRQFCSVQQMGTIREAMVGWIICRV